MTGYYPHWDVIRGIAINPQSHVNTCLSGYTMDAFGGVHPFADTTSSGCSSSNIPGVPVTVPHWNFPIARGIGLQSYGQGYILDGYGAVHNFGGAKPALATGYWPGWDITRGITVSTLGSGYVVDGWGGVHPFGPDAPPVPVSGYWPHWDIVRGID